MARPINVSLTGVAAVTNSVVASQSPGAGAITINGTLASGGVATLASPARVTLTSGGNDTGITFTVVGTNRNGNPQSETVTGASGAAATTTQDFKTITSITHTGSVATTLIAGNSITASSMWVMADYHSNPLTWTIATVLSSGSATWSLEYTLDDPNASFTGTYPTVFAYGPMTAATATADVQTGDYPAIAWRITLTAGTGTVKAVFLQSGLAGH